MLRHILHDWSDSACRRILENIAPAMEKGKSKLLIVETVLPPTNPPVVGTLMDIHLMAYPGAERTKSAWEQLLDSVGLRIVKIWYGQRHDSVIECVPSAWTED